MKATKEQLKQWKSEHGRVVEIEIVGKRCYLKPPTRQAIGLSLSYQNTDPLRADEILLENCWIDGDEIIKNDNDLLLSIRPHLAELFNIKTSKVVKH